MPITNSINTFNIYNEFGNYPVSGVACSSDGYVLYACYQQQPGLDFIISKNEGKTWSKMTIQTPNDFASGRFITIACGSTGTIIYSVCESGHGFVKSVDSGLNWSHVFATGFLDGDTGDNIKRIACDSTGTNLIASSYSNKHIYVSIDSGLHWTSVHSVSQEMYCFNVASNADGSILYASIGNDIFSNGFENWMIPINGNVSGKWESIACDSTGDKIFATMTSGLYIFSRSSPNILFASYGISSYIASNTNGNRLVVYSSPNMNTYEIDYSNTQPEIANMQLERSGVQQTDVSCFKKDTKILTDNGYIKIQKLKIGDMIKTAKHGFKPILLTGYRQMYNRALVERNKNQLYKCTNEKYPEIFEDLIITGSHSILVDEFKPFATDTNLYQHDPFRIENTQSESLFLFINARDMDGSNEDKSKGQGEREKTLQILHKIYITDDKYRLPACVDERAVVYPVSGEFTIYHIALENDDHYTNYGIYANGLLVESCSIVHLQDRFTMSLLHMTDL
jgi:hypothetical protein